MIFNIAMADLNEIEKFGKELKQMVQDCPLQQRPYRSNPTDDTANPGVMTLMAVSEHGQPYRLPTTRMAVSEHGQPYDRQTTWQEMDDDPSMVTFMKVSEHGQPYAAYKKPERPDVITLMAVSEHGQPYARQKNAHPTPYSASTLTYDEYEE